MLNRGEEFRFMIEQVLRGEHGSVRLRLGGEVVKIVFLMELAGLKGRERLKEYDVESVICYEGK